MRVDRLSDQDVQILKLESGPIRGHTCKVVILEPREGRSTPGVEELRGHIASRLDLAPRFRRRLAPTPLGVAAPVWVDDEAFDIANHVRPVAAGGPVDRGRLLEIVAGLMSERLDRARPLWAMDVVERMEDGSSALIWRIHHCMADGVTAVKLASALLWDAEPDAPPRAAVEWRPQPGPGRAALLALGMGDRVRRVARLRRRAGAEPRRLPDPVAVRRELARTAASSPFDRAAGRARTVAFTSVPLADLGRIGKAHGEHITINDVVLTVVSGGVRAWLERHHASEEGIRVKVPVSLHHHDAQEDTLGNRDSYFFVDLPVGEADPVRRMLAINRETTDRKRHHDAEALYHLGLHPTVARWAMSARVFTFSVSNVPGPREPIYVGGARVRELYSLAEIAQHHALRVAVISAAGTMFFSLCADRDAVEGLDTLARGLDATVAELAARPGR